MINRSLRLLAMLIASALAAAAIAQDELVRPFRGDLTGAGEASPGSTGARGTMEIAVQPDGGISGAISVSGTAAATAEIHEVSAGREGPAIISLVRSGDGSFLVPSGARLTQSQYESYLAGNLYVVVPGVSAPGGELRGQILRPVPTLGTRLNDPLQPQLAPNAPMTAPMGVTTPMSGRGRK